MEPMSTTTKNTKTTDILDLLAAADRHDGPQAELMRSILQSKLAHAGRGSLMVG